jgi:D-glucosaminate-6-phosphate ammonia-lyase
MKTSFISALVLAVLVLTAPFAGAQTTAPADVSGTWVITITFISGTATHTVAITQNAGNLTGTWKGSLSQGPLRGTVTGNDVAFSASMKNQSAGATFRFSGKVSGNTMQGTVDLGEYSSSGVIPAWTAKFTAKKQ